MGASATAGQNAVPLRESRRNSRCQCLLWQAGAACRRSVSGNERKEDAFLREIQNTIRESLQTTAPMNFAPWMQLMQGAAPANTTEKPEESEDMDAALDFADSF